MKKILYSIFTLAMATMVGCQKSDIDDTQNNPTNSESKITVTANIVSDGQTRVALTPETDGEGNPVVKVDWKNSGEEFDVFIMDDEFNLLASKKFEQIEGTNQFSSESPYDGTFNICLAYYPSGLIVHSGNFQQSKDIFSLQNGKLSEERTYMSAGVYALNENTKFDFRHMTTLLMPKFRVQGAEENLSPANIASITFKSERVNGGDTDIKIDCSELGAKDDIYVYLPEDSASGKIEVVVTTNNEIVFDGEIDLEGRSLLTGKLYTANIWLTPVVPNNVITYTTSNDEILSLDNNWGVGDGCVYTSHTFADGVGVGQIVLKDGITSIPGYGFYNLDYLQSIKLPSAITTIGNCAFGSASGLLSIDLNNITVIGAQAFSSCFALSEVTMPNNNYTIGNQSFCNCAITEIDLSNASSIDDYAFQGCNKLTTVIINNSTPPEFGFQNPFTYCTALESIYVPYSKVDDYKAIPALSEVAKKIKPISEMPQ